MENINKNSAKIELYRKLINYFLIICLLAYINNKPSSAELQIIKKAKKLNEMNLLLNQQTNKYPDQYFV